MRVTYPLLLIALCLLLGVSSCKKKKNTDDATELKLNVAYTLTDVKYGTDTRQSMDVYLPKDRNAGTKTFVLVHGGGWNAGSKDDFQWMFNALKLVYPNHAIVNLNYRLGTVSSPGYPKQTNDIQSALNEIELPKYGIGANYMLIGASAGGHLSLLYGYKHANVTQIAAICNVVGPTDFSDPSYTQDPNFTYGLYSLVGNITYAQDSTVHWNVSPAKYVQSTSPKTISFFGDADPLIPATQGPILHNLLDAAGVVNEMYIYAGEGHLNWSQANSSDFNEKLVTFINTHFNY